MKRSMSMADAKASFYVNMGEVMEQQARISGRELTAADRKLFSKELRFPEVVVRVAKFNPDSVSPMELAALRERERQDRAEQLAQLVHSGAWNESRQNEEGACVTDLLTEPEYL